MMNYLPTLVLRHDKERLKKCTLRGMEGREDFCFYSYPCETLPDLSQSVLLSFDGEPLGENDASSSLFVLDATWRYAGKMHDFVESKVSLPKRTLPVEVRSAYPRKQSGCSEPDRGLASIEAIYVAYSVLGRDVSGLLDNYYWKDLFLEKNREFFSNLS